MRGIKQKTWIASGKKHKREWFVIDATDMVLGRLSTRVAMILMGKHKPTYTPFLDTGDHVIVVNAEKIKLSGKKRDTKEYQSYSGYCSGRKVVPFERMIDRHPNRVVEHAVTRMIRNTRLGRQMRTKLFVYTGADHPHQAQKPKKLEVR